MATLERSTVAEVPDVSNRDRVLPFSESPLFVVLLSVPVSTSTRFQSEIEVGGPIAADQDIHAVVGVIRIIGDADTLTIIPKDLNGTSTELSVNCAIVGVVVSEVLTSKFEGKLKVPVERAIYNPLKKF